MSRLLNRIRGRIHGWFDVLETPPVRSRIRPTLQNLEDRVTPATFTVSNVFDTGAGSLRQAVLDANASSGADDIEFDAGFSTSRRSIPLMSQLAITDSVTIHGPGADKLYIVGGTTGFRAFANVTGGVTFTVNDLTITNFSSSNTGGAISTAGGANLHLNRVTITGNHSGTAAGGGIAISGNGGVHTITGSTISNNSSGNTGTGQGGGGIRISNSGSDSSSLTITNSTFSGNSALNGGAINARSMNGTLNIINSTIVSNTATNTTAGVGLGVGGIGRDLGSSALTVNVNNSIIASNSSQNGNPDLSFNATVVLNADFALIGNQSTATFNTLTNSQSGITGSELPANVSTLGFQNGFTTPIHIPLGKPQSAAIGTGTATYNNTDQSGANRSAPHDIGSVDITHAGTPFGMIASALPSITTNIATPYTFDMRFYDAIGISDASIAPGNITITLANGTSFPANTAVIDTNSPVTARRVTYGFTPPDGTVPDTWDANENGIVSISLGANQVENTQAIEIAAGFEGAFAVQIATPLVTGATVANITATTTAHTFIINYFDPTGSKLNAASFMDNLDVRVTGPGFNQLASFVSATPAGNQFSVAVTYSITGPGGAWDASENGNTYALTLEPLQVSNTAGIFVPASALGDFYVSFPTTYIVTNPDDSGPGSLRDRITLANAFADSADTITFDPLVFSNGQVINLFSALPSISAGVTITGPGMSKLTIQRAAGTPADFPIFKITDGIAPNAISVSLTGMTLIGNGASVVEIADEDVTLNAVTISGASHTGSGGGIAIGGGHLTLNQSVISGNSGGNFGGGIAALAANTTINITASTIENNIAFSGGGIGFNSIASGSALSVIDSTISGNSATNSAGGSAYSGGGGILFQPSLGTAGFVIRNSTISGNTSNLMGGGLTLIFNSGTALIQNSTITGNSAKIATVSPGDGGGGIAVPSAISPAVLSIESTIISGNNATNGRHDIATVLSGLTFELNTSAVGTQQPGTGYVTPTGSGNLAVAQSSLASLALGPLQFNQGGITRTHDLLSGSTALNAGSNPAMIAFDQNGKARQQNGGVDIGSVERTSGEPAASIGNLPSVNANLPGTNNPYQLVVTYTDDVAINFTTIGSSDILVSKSGGGFNIIATLVTTNPVGQNAPQIVATYQFSPPGGTWDVADNGQYTVTMLPAAVGNTMGQAVPQGTLGTIAVNFVTTFVVTNTNDSGTGSFRQALLDANANAGAADSIIFEATTFGSTPRTITLTSGELPISDAITITGPGAGLLTISGNKVSRIFNIDAPGTPTVTIADITLTNGRAFGDGGAVLIQDEVVNLNRMTLTQNKATGHGGALAMPSVSGGILTIQDSVISFNTVSTAMTSDGGGIAIGTPGAANNGLFFLRNSNVSNNSAPDDGGGIALASGVSMQMEGSLVARNVAGYAALAGDGGGIYFSGSVGSQGFVIRNSTLSANTTRAIVAGASVSGGGLGLVDVSGAIQILNSTITANVSGGKSSGSGEGGGGIAMTGINATLALNSTLVAGNFAANGKPDITAATPVNSNRSAIGSHLGFTDGTATNNLANGIDLKLGVLTGNGGLNATHAILPGSPLIDAGINVTLGDPPLPPLTTDQRGSGFLRSEGLGVDIGAFERKPGIPLALPTSNQLPDINGSTQLLNAFIFTITFTSDDDLNLSTINGDEVLITGPNGFSVVATLIGLDNSTSTTTRTATYRFTPPGGTWDASDNGIYQITIRPGSVSTINNQFVFSGMSSSFAVIMPLTFIVTNTLNNGAGSLRDAINSANGNGSGTVDIISFSPLFDSGQTIILSSGPIPITGGVNITGPGADKLTVNGGGINRIFNIDNSDASQIGVTISGLTLTNGSTAGDGGAIQFANENLTLTEVHVTGNTAGGNGGGLAASTYGATFNSIRSTVSSNFATTGGSSEGGGIFMNGTILGGTATILNSTLAKNSAAATGGGFAGSFGGGVGISLNLDQSTITANTAVGAGGGFGLGSNTSAFATLSSTIVANNSGAGTAPDISLAAVNSSYSAIGSSAGFNQASFSNDIFYGTPLLLGTLANNGGPTPTIALGALSPAIDAGPGFSSEFTDQRLAGYGRFVGISPDIGAYEVQPTITSLIVNAGDAQRSRIISIEVFFNNDVVAANFTGLGAVKLTRTDVSTIVTGAIGDVVQTGALAPSSGLITVAQGATNSLLLTFSNTDDMFFVPVPQSAFVENTSLSDGYWQLSIGNYASPLNSLDLRRLFGDSTATAFGTIDGADLTVFGNLFNSNSIAFDFNNDGTIDGNDLTVFGNRFNNVL